MFEIETGASARLEFMVTDDDTAIALGSGDVAVLATPRAIAWAEAATCAAVADGLSPSETTVGSRVDVVHRAPTGVGATVTVEATLAEFEGRRLEFEVRLTNPDGTTAMSGVVSRVRVERERFA